MRFNRFIVLIICNLLSPTRGFDARWVKNQNIVSNLLLRLVGHILEVYTTVGFLELNND
jgi:hypothetical protein